MAKTPDMVGKMDDAEAPTDDKPIGICTVAEIMLHLQKREQINFVCVWFWKDPGAHMFKWNIAALRTDYVHKRMTGILQDFIARKFD